MKRLQIDKDSFSEYAKNHTLENLAVEFGITKQQAKDYCRHHNIEYVFIQEHHGLSRTPQYKLWQGMIARCERPETKDYHRYGGRGIKVCAEWHDKKTFIQWCLDNGWQKGLQLDRIDNNGDYCPTNCHFVTPKDNMKNRRNTLMFKGVSLADLLDNAKTNPYGLDRHTVWYRIKVRGWSIEKALNTKLKY